MEKENLDQKKENLNQKEENRLEQDLRQMADDVTLPDSLEPEAIRRMLYSRQEEKEKAFKEEKKKKRWKRMIPIAAAACVCIAVGITAGVVMTHKDRKTAPDAAAIAAAEDQTGTARTLTTAKDYKEIKKAIKAYEKKMAKDDKSFARGLSSSSSSADSASASGVETASYAGESSNVSDSASYSDTNIREAGVGEADIVKTDGKNIYTLRQSTVTITAVTNGSLEKLSSIEQDAERYVEEMYVQEDKLVLFGTMGKQVGDAEDGGYYENNTYVQVYDISDPSNPTEIGAIEQSGGYNTSRIVDGYVYVLSNFHPYEDNVTARDPWYIPEVQGKSMAAEDIYMPQEMEGNEYTIITSFSLNDPTEKTDSKAVFGYSDVCYVSENNIYVTSNCYEDSDVSRTLIRKISYTDGKLEGVGQTQIKGTLNDSFSIDEYNGNLRLVTTIDEVSSNDDVAPLFGNGTDEDSGIAVQSEETEDTANTDQSQVTEKGTTENAKDAVPGTNSLYVLNEKLEIIGSIHNLAKDESIYSARFMGDVGYFVTYRQMDPLFSVDLSDPENPTILGKLKIPGFSEYLHPYGDGKLLGIGMDVSEDGVTTEGVKVSMFNVSDPSNVTEENKYTIEDTYGTDVGYNYKGVFVDTEKNLFGFITYHDGVTYHLFTYDENEGFKEVMSRQMNGYEGCRALYVDDVLYLVNGNTIESYTMDGFEKIDDIVL